MIKFVKDEVPARQRYVHYFYQSLYSMNKKFLPPMLVEKRTGKPHNIPAPDTSVENMDMQLQETIVFNQAALKTGWTAETLRLLHKYISVYLPDLDRSEIPRAVEEVLGFSSWGELSVFVQDDECLEFFNLLLKYCKREQQPHQRDKDFIDGSGIGYVKAYTNRLKKTLEHCFDAKYHYKVKRPLVYALEDKNIPLTEVANYIHPGHWSYPAGHGTKFLTAVEVIRDVFKLDGNCSRYSFIAAAAASMARCGSLIHFPMDNLAGGYLTELKEFAQL